MDKRFFTLFLFLFVGILAVWAQSKQDSPFLQQLPVVRRGENSIR